MTAPQVRPSIGALRVRGLLSFSPDAETLKLGALNVLIGPNGSGKSNLVDIVGLLQATSADLTLPLRIGGG